MRAAAARRTIMAYGGLAHQIPDDVTKSWVEPALSDAGVRADLIRFLKASDTSIMIDAGERLPGLAIPALIAWGQADRFFARELGERLAAAIPNARLERIADARTFVSEDAPEALAKLIGGFVRQAAPQAA
jgi:pimeloyl-ACP methyl ester carboxylesterase